MYNELYLRTAWVEADGNDRCATNLGTQLTLAVYPYVVAHQLLYKEYEIQHRWTKLDRQYLEIDQ